MSEHPPDTERGSSARGEVERIELDRQHAAFARKMAESKATAPHVYLGAEAEMTRALELIAAGEVAVRDLILRASALALRELPRANGAYRDGAVELYSRINPCFAVTAESGVIYPTVFDADTKSLDEIAQKASAIRGTLHNIDLQQEKGRGRDEFTCGIGKKRQGYAKVIYQQAANHRSDEIAAMKRSAVDAYGR